ncbi:hypothetical protein chiPu_0019133 [Chiloscyllium punctatum]|uniref:BAR domain-containing protein n=1 Tax=Chiloscyllium punctatum TaxID=137246 RepID=A0A401RRD6_CHIPU|nr:hypothetical protein [Chiloscyllium punctatum]
MRIPFKIGQPKKQIVPKTVERDFEREYGKLQQLEDQIKKLHKDMKKSTEADIAMSKSAVKISSDLLANPLCEQDQMFMETVTALDTAMRRMDTFNQEKVNQVQKTAIEPLKNNKQQHSLDVMASNLVLSTLEWEVKEVDEGVGLELLGYESANECESQAKQI